MHLPCLSAVKRPTLYTSVLLIFVTSPISSQCLYLISYHRPPMSVSILSFFPMPAQAQPNTIMLTPNPVQENATPIEDIGDAINDSKNGSTVHKCSRIDFSGKPASRSMPIHARPRPKRKPKNTSIITNISNHRGNCLWWCGSRGFYISSPFTGQPVQPKSYSKTFQT